MIDKNETQLRVSFSPYQKGNMFILLKDAVVSVTVRKRFEQVEPRICVVSPEAVETLKVKCGTDEVIRLDPSCFRAERSVPRSDLLAYLISSSLLLLFALLAVGKRFSFVFCLLSLVFRRLPNVGNDAEPYNLY